MAYTVPPTFTLGQFITQSDLNTYLTANMASIWVGSTAGDMDFYSSSNSKTKLPIGNKFNTLHVSASGLPEWAQGVYTRAYHTSSYSVPNSGTAMAFPFLGFEDQDPYGFHSSNNGYLVVPTNMTGFYTFGASGYFSAASASYRELKLKINGTEFMGTSTIADPSAPCWISCSTGAYLTAGDKIEPFLVQLSSTASLGFDKQMLWIARAGG